MKRDTNLKAITEEAVPEASYSCPGCGSPELKVFYERHGVPVNPSQVMYDRDSAINCEKGMISLGFCPSCGLISNTSFEENAAGSPQNENTKAFSFIYNAYQEEWADYLVDDYGVSGKEIIEVGCGMGDFLSLLCETGGNSGIGFDPSFNRERAQCKTFDDIRFVKDLYSQKYSNLKGDLVVSALTLEHTKDAKAFLKLLRSAVKGEESLLFIQVPDGTRILNELAFWDIHYERSSYFMPSSLAYLFRASGLEILEIRRDFGGHYITVIASPLVNASPSPVVEDFSIVKQGVEYFSQNCCQKKNIWRERVKDLSESGYRVALWGAGPKAVAFLNTLGITDEIRYVVDINPYKQNTFIPGTGHEIVPPSRVREDRPDAIIVMNPIYLEEVENDLKRMRTSVELITI